MKLDRSYYKRYGKGQRQKLKKPEVTRPVMAAGQGMKFYIVAIVRGRPYVAGGYDTEEEARAIAREDLKDYVYDVVPAATRDDALATQQAKHHIFMDTGNIEVATHNAMHKMPERGIR